MDPSFAVWARKSITNRNAAELPLSTTIPIELDDHSSLKIDDTHVPLADSSLLPKKTARSSTVKDLL